MEKNEFKVEAGEVKVYQKTKKIHYKENQTIYERRVNICPEEQVRIRVYEIQQSKKSYLQIGGPRGYVTLKLEDRDSIWKIISEIAEVYGYLHDHNLLPKK